MGLQILPPDLKPQDKIETKEAQPYWKPSSLNDGESEEFRLLGCYDTGHAICGWQYASEIADSSTGELRFNGYVVTRTYPEGGEGFVDICLKGPGLACLSWDTVVWFYICLSTKGARLAGFGACVS